MINVLFDNYDFTTTDFNTMNTMSTAIFYNIFFQNCKFLDDIYYNYVILNNNNHIDKFIQTKNKNNQIIYYNGANNTIDKFVSNSTINLYITYNCSDTIINIDVYDKIT
jgi:hypothetical protein